MRHPAGQCERYRSRTSDDPSTPLFRVRSVVPLFVTRVTSNSPNQMLSVAVGYQVMS
jgi:hypothetical protein